MVAAVATKVIRVGGADSGIILEVEGSRAKWLRGWGLPMVKPDSCLGWTSWVEKERKRLGDRRGASIGLQFLGTLQTWISMFDKDLNIHCQGYIKSIRCEQTWNAADRPTHQDASRVFSADLGAALSVSVLFSASSTLSGPVHSSILGLTFCPESSSFCQSSCSVFFSRCVLFCLQVHWLWSSSLFLALSFSVWTQILWHLIKTVAFDEVLSQNPTKTFAHEKVAGAKP